MSREYSEEDQRARVRVLADTFPSDPWPILVTHMLKMKCQAALGKPGEKSLKSKDFSVYPRTGRGSPWSSSPANLEEFVKYVGVSMKCRKVICHRNRFFFFLKGRKKSHRVLPWE